MANYDLTYEGSRVQGILDTGNSLKDAGYIFRGEATPSTVPGTPTERVAYIGGPGTYTNFGGSITVGAGCICVFKYTGSAWSNQVINTGLSDAISSAISSEATTRSEAETALQNAISSEATTRSEADTALQNAINSEATTRSEADTALQNAITAINNNIGNGYVFAGVAIPSTSPVTGKVFYLAVQAGTYTNFEDSEETPLAVTAGINILKNTGTGWVLDQVIAIDAEPTQGSANLVKSGGVLNSIIQNGPAFDLSAYNAQEGVLATYADLNAALTALDTLPADFKKGGMSIKFVLTSDNKYVQARLKTQAWSSVISDWVDVEEREIQTEKTLDEVIPIIQNDNIVIGYQINASGIKAAKNERGYFIVKVLEGSTELTINNGTVGSLSWYSGIPDIDAGTNFVQRDTHSDLEDRVYPIPSSTCKYAIITLHLGYSYNNVSVEQDGQLASIVKKHLSEIDTQIENINETVEGISEDVSKIQYKELVGKKVIFLGDSITAGNVLTQHGYSLDDVYHKVFADLAGASEHVNLGVGGSTIATKTNASDQTVNTNRFKY